MTARGGATVYGLTTGGRTALLGTIGATTGGHTTGVTTGTTNGVMTGGHTIGIMIGGLTTGGGIMGSGRTTGITTGGAILITIRGIFLIGDNQVIVHTSVTTTTTESVTMAEMAPSLRHAHWARIVPTVAYATHRPRVDGYCNKICL